MKIAVVLGSTRPHRLGERVAKWVMRETSKYPQSEFILLDLQGYNLPFFNEDEGPRGNENRHLAENVAKCFLIWKKQMGIFLSLRNIMKGQVQS
ncbi:MAG TPA: NAD(P)H-dependent oxidoreductase [Candidatus Saccharimonadales bacterium]|nr:NAD(P)H-dependent oxidoreductase [Candidatus Saccharimonadales bacterium]